MTDSPVAEVDEPVRAAIRALAERLAGLGARVTADALPFDDHAAHHATYLQLLRGSASARLPQAVFEEAVLRLTEPGTNATPYVARMAQAHAQRHRDWILAEERRATLKRDWATFFEDYDVLLAPVTVCAAFPIDEARPREEAPPADQRTRGRLQRPAVSGPGGDAAVPAGDGGPDRL